MVENGRRWWDLLGIFEIGWGSNWGFGGTEEARRTIMKMVMIFEIALATSPETKTKHTLYIYIYIYILLVMNLLLGVL